MKMKPFVKAVEQELARARKNHSPMPTTPHALGIIREEYLEVEVELIKRDVNKLALLEELIQLAAMCQRAAEDLGLIDDSPNV